MSNTETLRMLGYSAADGKLVCQREGVPGRYAHEQTGVIRIDLEKDSAPGRELVERLLAVISEPRALVGRAKNGSVVVLGRCEREIKPYIPGDSKRTGRFELITKADGVKFTITCASENQIIDPEAFSWGKRSPLDVPRDSLAMLFSDIGEAVVAEAMRVATWAPTAEEIERERARIERLSKIREEMAAGMHTPEAIAAREDEALAASMPADISYSDGPLASNVLAARKRIALRKQQAAAAA
ncbi:MAG: hypothetical protein ACLPV8_02000 [Steroidobacteraceae bacterium]